MVYWYKLLSCRDASHPIIGYTSSCHMDSCQQQMFLQISASLTGKSWQAVLDISQHLKPFLYLVGGSSSCPNSSAFNHLSFFRRISYLRKTSRPSQQNVRLSFLFNRNASAWISRQLLVETGTFLLYPYCFSSSHTTVVGGH